MGSLNTTLKENIKYGFLLKLLGTLLTFLSVKLLFECLDAEKYGIWSTLYGLISWTIFLDFGISHGARNLLTSAFARNQKAEVQKIITTSFILMLAITLLCLLSVLILPHSFYENLLRVPSDLKTEVGKTIQFLLVFIIINFSSSILNAILLAVHNSALVALGTVVVNFLSIVGFFCLYLMDITALDRYAIVYGASLLTSTVLLVIIAFRRSRHIVPNFTKFEKNLIQPLLKLGFYFFILQVFTVFILSYLRVLILNFSGAAVAAQYDICNRLYSVLNVFALIIVTPFWSAFTQAYINNDIIWIKNSLRKLNYLMLLLILGGLGIFISMDFLVDLWIGNHIPIDKSMSLLVMTVNLLTIWLIIYSTISNAISRFKVQAVCLLLGSVINHPLAKYFSGVLGLKDHGPIISSIICLSFYAIIVPFNVYSIIREKDKQPVNR